MRIKGTSMNLQEYCSTVVAGFIPRFKFPGGALGSQCSSQAVDGDFPKINYVISAYIIPRSPILRTVVYVKFHMCGTAVTQVWGPGLRICG